MNRIITIPSLSDNYIYLYQYNTTDALAIDPCDSSAVHNALKESGLNLTMILATHDHWDHTAGISDLKKMTGCKVFAGSKTTPGIDCVVTDGEIVDIGGRETHCIATPGHTHTSFCYYIPSAVNDKGVLFTGDTLFVAGCGRVFECDAKTMFESLQKLTFLPDDTLIYCGHDYTVENFEFALTVEPENEVIKKCLQEAKRTVKEKKPTVPSTISQELVTNLFLRAKTAADFAELRHQKDLF